MKRASSLKHLTIIALTMAGLHGSASAAGIIWGSVFADLLFNSTASVDNPADLSTQQLDTSFSFEIGTFEGGFIPTYQNFDQWVDNWKVFDRAYDPDANGWNSTDQFFAGFAEHNITGNSESPDANPLDVFTQGERIYLWVYNDKNGVGSEWALVTDTVLAGNTGSQWVIPDPLDPPGSSYELKLEDADEVIVGGVNGVRGEGTFAYGTTPAAFSLQTAVVPEPGSAMLLFAAATAFLARRASRRLTRAPMA